MICNHYKKIEELVIEAKLNNESAIIELYNMYLPYVKYWISKSFINSYTKDDITQEYYLWLINAINKYSGTNNFTSYITVTIRNNIFMLIRKTSNIDIPSEINSRTSSDASSDADALLSNHEYFRLVNSADNLSDIEKTIVNLYYFDDLTLYTISEILDIKYSTLAKIKSKAITKIAGNYNKLNDL